jgi:hypothetical protein
VLTTVRIVSVLAISAGLAVAVAVYFIAGSGGSVDPAAARIVRLAAPAPVATVPEPVRLTAARLPARHHHVRHKSGGSSSPAAAAVSTSTSPPLTRAPATSTKKKSTDSGYGPVVVSPAG